MTPRRVSHLPFSVPPQRPNSCEESSVSAGAVPFLVDEDDRYRVAKYEWKTRTSTRAIYACAMIQGKRVDMHVFLMGSKPGLMIDHANRNGLDNRRENLRWATRSQNQMNIEKPRFRKGTSKFKGVYWLKANKRWRAKIRKDRIGYCLGTFTSEVMAAQCYDAAARRMFGEFAKTNFPDVA